MAPPTGAGCNRRHCNRLRRRRANREVDTLMPTLLVVEDSRTQAEALRLDLETGGFVAEVVPFSPLPRVQGRGEQNGTALSEPVRGLKKTLRMPDGWCNNRLS